METCNKCNKTAEVNLSYGEAYCKAHFLYLMEKRIKKVLREIDFDIKKKYSLESKEYAEHDIITHFFNEIFYKINYDPNGIKISIKTGEEFGKNFIEQFTHKKKLKTPKIAPLKGLVYEDIFNLVKILKIKKPLLTQKSNIDFLEKKYPGTKFAVLKSLDYFEKKR